MTRLLRWRPKLPLIQIPAGADEGPINPTAEAKRLGANLATPKKLKLLEKEKSRQIPAVKTAIKPTSSANK